MSVNNVVLTGTLARDPQLSYPERKQPVVRIFVRTLQREKNEAGKWVSSENIVPVVAHGALAERTAGYFKEGSLVEVEGRIKGFSFMGAEGPVTACAVLAFAVREQREAKR